MHKNTKVVLICFALLLVAGLCCCGAKGARWLVREFVLQFGEKETVYSSKQQAEVFPTPTPTPTPYPEEPYLLWETHLVTEPLLDGETVYIIGEERDVGALHLPTQTRFWVWEYFEEADHFLGQDEERVYVQRRDRRVYALDKETGETVWKFRHSSFGFPEETVLKGGNLHFYFNVRGNLYSQQYVVTLDAETGEELWTVDLGSFSRFQDVACGKVFVVVDLADSFSNEARILDAETGEVQAKISPVISWSGTAVGNTAFLGVAKESSTFADTLWGVDCRSGEVLWEHKSYYVQSFPGKVLVRLDSRDYTALDLDTGKSVWGSSGQGGLEYTGRIGELIFFVSENRGETRAVELESGAVRWINDELEATWPIAATQQGLLIADRKWGRIYLVDPKTGEFVWKVSFEEDYGRPYLSDVLFLGKEIFAVAGYTSYLLDLETGAVEWSQKLRNLRGQQSLHRAGDLVVLYSEDYLAVFRYSVR